MAGKLPAAVIGIGQTHHRAQRKDAVDEATGDQLDALNRAYRARFGFPLVVCAREHTPHSILAKGQLRLANAPQEEERTALAEVAKIARLRLADLVAEGP